MLNFCEGKTTNGTCGAFIRRVDAIAGKTKCARCKNEEPEQ